MKRYIYYKYIIKEYGSHVPEDGVRYASEGLVHLYQGKN